MQMTTENSTTYYNSNSSTSDDVKAILPEPLIEYLWKLALNGDWAAYEKQQFILEAGELSGQKIQDIYHSSSYENLIDTHRIYGTEPVNCKLEILNFQSSYEMVIT